MANTNISNKIMDCSPIPVDVVSCNGLRFFAPNCLFSDGLEIVANKLKGIQLDELFCSYKTFKTKSLENYVDLSELACGKYVTAAVNFEQVNITKCQAMSCYNRIMAALMIAYKKVGFIYNSQQVCYTKTDIDAAFYRIDNVTYGWDTLGVQPVLTDYKNSSLRDHFGPHIHLCDLPDMPIVDVIHMNMVYQISGKKKCQPPSIDNKWFQVACTNLNVVCDTTCDTTCDVLKALDVTDDLYVHVSKHSDNIKRIAQTIKEEVLSYQAIAQMDPTMQHDVTLQSSVNVVAGDKLCLYQDGKKHVFFADDAVVKNINKNIFPYLKNGAICW